mmetsp:Transcript_28878/g.97355  ORF Transcript_28878/g.97355 Transcript_28878/m.97355 type:complete len:268 (-) Transcript_28878:275-1078(-)
MTPSLSASRAAMQTSMSPSATVQFSSSSAYVASSLREMWSEPSTSKKEKMRRRAWISSSENACTVASNDPPSGAARARTPGSGDAARARMPVSGDAAHCRAIAMVSRRLCCTVKDRALRSSARICWSSSSFTDPTVVRPCVMVRFDRESVKRGCARGCSECPRRSSRGSISLTSSSWSAAAKASDRGDASFVAMEPAVDHRRSVGLTGVDSDAPSGGGGTFSRPAAEGVRARPGVVSAGRFGAAAPDSHALPSSPQRWTRARKVAGM